MNTVTLPWPDRRLSPNARVHWAEKAKRVRQARQTAWALARSAGLSVPDTRPLPVRVTFHPPDRRRRDRDNMVSCAKAICDGIADAIGVDDALWEPTYSVAEPRKGGAVVVEIAP
jgi:crossover junction endodeoxyribonuclease RusA